MDGASTDRTLDIVRSAAEEDPRIRVVHNPAGSIPTSLNLGLAAAGGRWLVRVDAHSTMPAGYVRTLVGHLASGRWGGVGGGKDAIARTPMGAAIAAALGSRAGVGDSAYHWATEPRRTDHVPFGAYPVALLRDLDGWDERLEANEDYELDLRIRGAGHDLLLDPSVRIAWRAKETLGSFFAQYRRYGRGKADVARLHPGTARPATPRGPRVGRGPGRRRAPRAVRPRGRPRVGAPYPLFAAGAAVWIAVRDGTDVVGAQDRRRTRDDARGLGHRVLGGSAPSLGRSDAGRGRSSGSVPRRSRRVAARHQVPADRLFELLHLALRQIAPEGLAAAGRHGVGGEGGLEGDRPTRARPGPGSPASAPAARPPGPRTGARATGPRRPSPARHRTRPSGSATRAPPA